MNKEHTSQKFLIQKNSRARNTQGGQVIIGALLLFLTISITVLVGIATPVAIQVRSAADFLQSKQSYISADVLNEEALYRLNKGKTLPSSIVLSFNDSTSTALISNIGTQKQVLATGISGMFTRLSQSIFTQGQGSFALNYGMQIGSGGITMSGSPTVNGNVSSNGDITGSGVSTINGNVVSASPSSQFFDQINGLPAVSQQNVTIGNTTATRDFAQSFMVSTTTPVSQVQFYIKKNKTPASARVYITADSSDKPSNTEIMSGVLNTTNILSTYTWVPSIFSTNTSLVPGVKYWLVISNPSVSTSKNLTIAVSGTDSYTSGTVKYGRYGIANSWTSAPAGYDGLFMLALGGANTISGVVVNGSANSYVVNSSTVSGTLYCQSGTSNNKSCNTSSSTPNAMTYPFSNTNISDWKTEATNGGVYNGDITITGVTATTTGPLKINGNLTVTSSGRMTMTGTIYVTGNVTIDGSAVLSLASSYGSKSGVLVADGVVTTTASAVLAGSGTTGSYITIATTNSCGGTSTTCTTTPAVSLGGNATSVIVFAPNGKINFQGSARANSLIGYAVSLTGNVVVDYNNTLSSIKFDNTSGGSTAWITDTWKEISQ